MITESYQDYERMIEELRSSEQLYEKFVAKGSYSVDVSRTLKRNIDKFYFRHKRFVKYERRSKNNLFSKYFFYGYMLWDSLALGMFEPRDKGYVVVSFFFRFFWGQIKKFEGEFIDEDTLRVTFYPRT